MIKCHPFSVDVSNRTLDAIRQRVADYPWHEMPVDGGWEYGTNLDYMKEFCRYWVNEFDWGKQQAKINQFSWATVQKTELIAFKADEKFKQKVQQAKKKCAYVLCAII